MAEVPVLETARFTLRPLGREDVAALFPTFADRDAMRWWARDAFESEEELAGWLLAPDWNGRAWAAVPKDGGPAVGRFIAMPRERQIAEVGYLVALDWQGKGVARECLAALVERLFAEGHRRLFADIDPDNRASQRVVESLGFRLEGRLRGNWHTHIGVRDSLIFGLLASDREAPRDSG